MSTFIFVTPNWNTFFENVTFWFFYWAQHFTFFRFGSNVWALVKIAKKMYLWENLAFEQFAWKSKKWDFSKIHTNFAITRGGGALPHENDTELIWLVFANGINKFGGSMDVSSQFCVNITSYLRIKPFSVTWVIFDCPLSTVSRQEKSDRYHG